ncbi:MAG: hypothetical protein JXA30_04500 [Deltaproteobacteria bacterium]|nr:hypothetical protein [Deltaproteobacteria bacterium]
MLAVFYSGAVQLGFFILFPCLPADHRACAQNAAKQGFTETEQKRLANGDLVVRPSTQRRGQWKLIGGSSWQVINSSPKVVWHALLDYQYYHRMLPRIIGVRLVDKKPDRQLVFIKQGTDFFQVSYYLNLNIHPAGRDITFNVDEEKPHTLRAGWGFYAVRPYGQNKTILAYGVMADIGDSIFISLVQDSVHEWMLKVPEMIKRFIEGSGRHIYKKIE